MKRLLKAVPAVILALMLVCTAITAISASDSDIPTLFERNGEYIAKDPVNTNKSWHLAGKDKNVIKFSDSGRYPLTVKNNTGSPSYFYISGSNSIEWLLDAPEYIDYLKNDFVIEYEITHDASSSGYISLVLAYNYKYYVDAYVNPDGTGDISLVLDGKAHSVMDEASILSATSSEKLTEALYGKGKSADLSQTTMVSLRVTVNEDRMPSKILMYINGCLVAYTDENMADLTAQNTPHYSIYEGSIFPSDKLGNMIAIKCTDGVSAQLSSLRIYSVDRDNVTPDLEGALFYADKYGNASFDPSDYGVDDTTDATDATDTTESESTGDTLDDTDTADDISESTYITEYESESLILTDTAVSPDDEGQGGTPDADGADDDGNMILYLCLTLGALCVSTLLAAVIALKMRTEKQ